mgnify:CR=1 FL=1
MTFEWRKPTILTILDGYGLREEEHGNAIKLANNPVFEMLWNKYPHTELIASGQEVGLPKGQMGNSEVGHINIGTGRKVRQPLDIINDSKQSSTLRSVDNILKGAELYVSKGLMDKKNLNGNIYEKSCYYQCQFTLNQIKQYNIDVNKLKNTATFKMDGKT